MDFEDGIELIGYAYKKQTDELILKRWIANYEAPLMGEPISFDDFRNQVLSQANKKEDIRTAKDILKDVEKILGGGEIGNI